MAKLEIGQLMPDFSYATPYESNLTLAETAAKTPKTALVFLRYYGCPMCQYDIQQYAQHYAELTAHGGQLLVVLQSDPIKLAETLGSPDALPFPIVCDPEQQLYKNFSIEPAVSMVKAADTKTVGKVIKATVGGFKHGAYEGNEMQLPAAFVITADRKLVYAHYAKTLTDMPDIKALVRLLQ